MPTLKDGSMPPVTRETWPTEYGIDVSKALHEALYEGHGKGHFTRIIAYRVILELESDEHGNLSEHSNIPPLKAWIEN